MPNKTTYFWSMLLRSGRVLTIDTDRPFSTELMDKIREEVGDFLDARVGNVGEDPYPHV